MQIKGALNKLALCVETNRNVNIEEAADEGRGEKKVNELFQISYVNNILKHFHRVYPTSVFNTRNYPWNAN